MLEKTTGDYKDATKELFIEMAVEDFLEKYQLSSENYIEDKNIPLYIEKYGDELTDNQLNK